jgi:Domain of unknown function (DUF5110)
VKQHTAEATEAPVQLWVYPGANGAFSFYEDDGKSFDYRKGESMRMNLAWDDRQRRLSARLARGSQMWGRPGGVMSCIAPANRRLANLYSKAGPSS